MGTRMAKLLISSPGVPFLLNWHLDNYIWERVRITIPGNLNLCQGPLSDQGIGNGES